MDRLVFTSLSGAKTGTIQRTMLTNDLANVSTVGFKRASFQRAVPAQLMDLDSRSAFNHW